MSRNPSQQVQTGIIEALATEWRISYSDATDAVREFFPAACVR